MTQKHIDQEIRLPNGKFGVDAYDAFAIVNENAQDAEQRLAALETGGQDVEQLKAGLQQETQLRADADSALSQAVAAEVSARQNADAAITARIAGKNALINGGFGFWQRGTSFTSSGTTGSRYTADRWSINGGGGASITIAANALASADYDKVENLDKQLPKITIGSDSSASHFAVLEQRIENVHTFAGETITVSFRTFIPAGGSRYIAIEMQQDFKGTAVSGIGSKKFQLQPGWTTVSHTVTMPSTVGKTMTQGHNVTLSFWLSGGSNWNGRNDNLGAQPAGDLYITDVQVERGTVRTAFENRHPAVELLLCQRYYEKSYDLTTVPGAATNPGRDAHAISSVMAATGWTTVRFATRKRGWPAVVIYPANTTGASPGNVAQNDGSITTAAVENVGTSGVQVAWGNQSGKFGAWFHWTADAEI